MPFLGSLQAQCEATTRQIRNSWCFVYSKRGRISLAAKIRKNFSRRLVKGVHQEILGKLILSDLEVYSELGKNWPPAPENIGYPRYKCSKVHVPPTLVRISMQVNFQRYILNDIVPQLRVCMCPAPEIYILTFRRAHRYPRKCFSPVRGSTSLTHVTYAWKHSPR